MHGREKINTMHFLFWRCRFDNIQDGSFMWKKERKITYGRRKGRKQKVKEITDKLEEGLKELFEIEIYIKSYLSTMSKFHNYSFNNMLLIAMLSDGELRETQTENYFSNLYPIDGAVPSVKACSCRKWGSLLSA